MSWEYGFRPYVSVAQRRQKALRSMDKLRKKGVNVQPVEIEGRKLARTFWGQSWCQHLESFSDYENRLPRGRTYVRNGSVCHLEIGGGEVKAIVSGSELYDVKITINKLPQEKWCDVKERCAGKIGSLLELLQGRLSSSVMTVVTDRHQGLFPLPSEISLDCSCPDWAVMCKHVAAAMYGVGARLDEMPELLFLLRGVDHEELIEADVAVAATVVGSKREGRRIAENQLADVFGIEIAVDKSTRNGADKTKPAKPKSESGVSRNLAKSEKSAIETKRRTIKKEKAEQKTTGKTVMPLTKANGLKQARQAVSKRKP